MDGQTYGRTDRHNEANRRFSQLCESAKNKKKKPNKDRSRTIFLKLNISHHTPTEDHQGNI
jgi:hypothetical protein